MSIGKMILNFNEFIPLLASPEVNLDAILEAIQDLANQLKKEDLFSNMSFHSINLGIDIPAISDIYKQVFRFSNDAYLTGITVGATGYNNHDTISVYIDNNCIIDNINLKEMAQYKKFSNKIYIHKGSLVIIEYNNKECHSKHFICDLDYISEPILIPYDSTNQDNKLITR